MTPSQTGLTMTPDSPAQSAMSNSTQRPSNHRGWPDQNSRSSCSSAPDKPPFVCRPTQPSLTTCECVRCGYMRSVLRATTSLLGNDQCSAATSMPCVPADLYMPHVLPTVFWGIDHTMRAVPLMAWLPGCGLFSPVCQCLQPLLPPLAAASQTSPASSWWCLQ